MKIIQPDDILLRVIGELLQFKNVGAVAALGADDDRIPLLLRVAANRLSTERNECDPKGLAFA